MSSTSSHIMERRSPKSPLRRSPMPKSPLPQSPEFYDKYKSKCAHGLINFFRFRQSHSKKLISDRTLSKRHAVEMKKIAGEGMPIKQQIKKTSVEHAQSDSVLGGEQSTNHRKAMKSSQRPRRLSIYGCYDVATTGHAKSVNEKLVVDSSKKLDSTAMEDTCSNQVQPKDERDCNCTSIHHGKYDQSKEMNLQVRMNEATEALINQKLIDGKHLSADGANHQPKHFMDALEILNSNKDLFIKLLQDPNSLLVKHIEDLQESQAKTQQIKSFPEAKFSEHQKNNSSDRSVCTQNFSSSDRYLAKGTGDSQPLETIVVLRPGSTSMQNYTDEISHDSPLVHYRLKNVQQSVKPSFFPFGKMKRKLMHAMGVSRKEQLLMLTDGAVHASKYDFKEREKRGKTGLDIDERNQMDKVEIIKSSVREEAAPASESGHESSKFSSLRHSKQNKKDKYLETRVHLSEFSKNGNLYLSRKRPKTWDGMNSLPENELLPTVSPRCKAEHDLVTPQMRFSPCSSYEMVNKNKWRNQSEKKNNLSTPLQNVEALPWADDESCGDQLQIIETKQSISDKLFPDVKADESIFSFENDLSPRGSMNIIGNKDSEISEEISPFCVPSKLDVSHNTDANESIYAANTTSEYESSNILRLDLPAENQTSLYSTSDCLSSPLSIQRVEDLDMAKERAELPNLMSFLEQFFMEDTIIPSSPASRCRKLLAELSVLPLQIGIEGDYLAPLVHSPLDLKINPSTSLEECGSVFDYIGAALRASGFNLDDLSSKCHSLCHDQSCGDHKFVCDYFVEVLLEVYQYYLRSSPWLSFIEPKVRPVTMAENMVQQAMKHVDRNLLLRPPSLTLEDRVENDLKNSAPWLDIWMDAEDVISMIVESVIEEVIVETAIE